MKKVGLINLIVILTQLSVAQTTYTANNSPGALTGANIFTGASALQDAVTAASAGDIIYVVRGTNDYGTTTIDKQLVIFGIGLNPDNEGSTRSKVSTLNITDPAASNTRISGLRISDRLNLGGISGTLTNIIIENCNVRWIQHTTSLTALSNLIIRNNVISSNFSSSDEHIDFIPGAVANIVVSNNIIYGNTQGGQGGINADNGTLFENNIFIGGGNAWEVFRDNIVKNNIFIGQSPQAQLTLSGNSFINNLSFNTSNDVFSAVNGNSSISNIEGSNPTFVNLPITNSIDFSTFDPSLQIGSPAIGTGENGTDMGVLGGGAPFDISGTSLPLIQTINVPSMISQGSDLPVNIKGKGN